MNYPSIRIEGSILSPDLIDRLEDLPGQRPSDFGLDSGTKVKDEIARAWADAQDYWRIFQRKLDATKADASTTTETRNLWIVPLLGLLKYDLEYQKQGAELNGKIYAISHRATNRALTPVHVVGYRDPAGLDRKPANATLRMSAHAMVQEYLNLTEQLYGVVTNGRVIRLLRDSSRLIKQSYLEFDLDRIFTDGLFADFAVLYRLVHASRLPVTADAAPESIIEKLHQDSLDSGARIREGLSRAVEEAILTFGNGFLAHPANDALRGRLASGALDADDYYKSLLRLIYRLLFLMVIEERGLVFPPGVTQRQRETYDRYYSLQRLRNLSEKRYLADKRQSDLWLALLSTFRLFEADGPGAKIGLKPLAGDLFRPDAIGDLDGAQLSNEALLSCLRSLGLYENPQNKQLIRVNYAALNVEEFGSVYEGLLEYEPAVDCSSRVPTFGFKQGDERSATGSHYTPDDLVQPLIKHSLDHLIAERLKEKDPERALLDLRVADIACGSGHILLAAARRIATEVAIVRTGEEQPSPSAYRTSLRDVIRTCIYGVDLNPLAVELCKVALWLEAHNPGEPLNFLDHHIKCGNAIVGFVKREEVDNGVADEAFAKLPGDDPEIGKEVRARNKRERAERNQAKLSFTPARENEIKAVMDRWSTITAMPERTPAEIDAKKQAFEGFSGSGAAWLLKQLASIPIAQFYIPRTEENEAKLITDGEFREMWAGNVSPQGQAPAAAFAVASRKRFFHWFIEFPEIVQRGGFDCILGNPPYLGGTKISTVFGPEMFGVIGSLLPPVAGKADLVAYFLRRAWRLLSARGMLACICTDRISETDSRIGAIDAAVAEGGSIYFGKKSVRWPGQATVLVTLLSLGKGPARSVPLFLGERRVARIQTNLQEGDDLPRPLRLRANDNIGFAGSYPYGEGFVVSNAEAHGLLAKHSRNADVVRPYLIGDDVNSSAEVAPSRYIIDFRDWSRERASEYADCFSILEQLVKPVRDPIVAAGKQVHEVDFWKFWDKRLDRYELLQNLRRVIVVARTGKPAAFTFAAPDIVYSDSVVVIASEDAALLGVLQSAIHYSWILQHCTTRGSTIVYAPSAILAGFPFPDQRSANQRLADLAEVLVSSRQELAVRWQVGLTTIYNLVSTRDLERELIEGRCLSAEARIRIASSRQLLGDVVSSIQDLRRLHVELDNAVLAAYGWNIQGEDGPPITLTHDFYDVETLPENDRTRYTISPAARKELLARLLKENHRRAAAEAASAPAATKKPAGKSRGKKKAAADDEGLFA